MRIGRVLRHEIERNQPCTTGTVGHTHAGHAGQSLQKLLRHPRLPVGGAAGPGVDHDVDVTLRLPVLRVDHRRCTWPQRHTEHNRLHDEATVDVHH